MSKIVSIDSSRSYAAIRAHRTMVASKLEHFVNPVARMALAEALAVYDRELEGAPARPEHVPADRKAAALRARRTMLMNALPGTRGKVRAELKARIASYDEKLAA